MSSLNRRKAGRPASSLRGGAAGSRGVRDGSASLPSSSSSAVIPFSPSLPAPIVFPNAGTAPVPLAFTVSLPAAMTVQSLQLTYTITPNAAAQFQPTQLSIQDDVFALPASSAPGTLFVSVGGKVYGPSVSMVLTGIERVGWGGTLTFNSLVFNVAVPMATYVVPVAVAAPPLPFSPPAASGSGNSSGAFNVTRVIPISIPNTSAPSYVVSASVEYSVASATPGGAAPTGVSLANVSVGASVFTSGDTSGNAVIPLGASFGPYFSLGVTFSFPANVAPGTVTFTSVSLAIADVTASSSVDPALALTLVDAIALLAVANKMKSAADILTQTASDFTIERDSMQAIVANTGQAAASVQAASAANEAAAHALSDTATSLTDTSSSSPTTSTGEEDDGPSNIHTRERSQVFDVMITMLFYIGLISIVTYFATQFKIQNILFKSFLDQSERRVLAFQERRLAARNQFNGVDAGAEEEEEAWFEEAAE